PGMRPARLVEPFDYMRQRRTGDVLQAQEVFAGLRIDAFGVDLDDVVVLDSREGLRLGNSGAVGNLQRHLPVERHLLGQVDAGKRAAAELSEDDEVPEALPGAQAADAALDGGGRQRGGPLGLRRRTLPEPPLAAA